MVTVAGFSADSRLI